MTDIVVGVRLNADGSGLVGQLRLSRTEFEQLTKAETGSAAAARDLSQATGEVVQAQSRAVQGVRQTNSATNEMTKNVGLARAGWQSFGFQIQDVFASAASGSRLAVIFAQQSGQMASSIAMIAQASEGSKGKLAGLASFLGGPWGIAIGVAVSAGSALVAMLLQADEAAGAAKIGASGLADAQGLLGQMFDLTTGKIKSQNELLLINARLMAINLRAEAQKERLDAAKGLAVAARDIRTVRATPIAGVGYAGGQVGASFEGSAISGLAKQAEAASRLKDVSKRSDALMDILAKSEKIDFSGANTTADEFRQYIVNLASSTAKEATSALIDKSLEEGELAPGLRQTAKPKKPKKDNSAEKAAKEAERLATFSDRAAESVARINDEYNVAPRDIDRARQATAQLDGVIGDVNKRLTTSKNLSAEQRQKFQDIKAEAERLKPVIQDSLVRPLLDMIQGQERQIELGRLQAIGRSADADALQLTYTLMDKMGVESEDQLATALAQRGVTEDQVRTLYDNLDVMREQTREMRVQQQMQQTFLTAISDMRENVRLTVEELRSGAPQALENFGKRFADVFDRMFSEVLVEKLFGNFFRDLEDQVTGGNKLSKVGDKLADAVGRASTDIKQTSTDIVDLGKAAAKAVALINGAAASEAVPPGWIVGDDGKAFDPNAPVVVTAPKEPTSDILKGLKSGFKEGYEGFFDELKGDFKDIFTDIFGDKGIFSESLGKTMGQLTAGAQTGATAGNLVTSVLGIKGSSTGGAIGGAIGSAIAGPIGSIVGGTLGSVLGGLTKSTPKASATITGGSDEDVSVSGNKDSLKKASVGLASSVQETLQQIAEEFGGQVGKFAVSIGIRHGDYRVDTSGSGKTKKKSGAIDFDDDQAGAIAYAVMDAITDGGITGISAAIQKALASSDDLDDALEEALKVKEVEQILGGLGAALEAQFKAFERQASERVRIATEYGFDVVAIEKKNAEDRAALIESLLEDQVGSLQRLVDEMTSGSLFEGSAIEQRDALMTQIAQAQADVDAGKDGAADRLAALFEKLLSVSEEAYGSTGQFAADRDMILAQAQAAIDAAEARIAAASGTGGGSSGSDPALATTNQALDENNDQNARLLALVAALPDEIAALLNGLGYSPLNTAALARTS